MSSGPLERGTSGYIVRVLRLVSRSRLVHFLLLAGLIFALAPSPRWTPGIDLDSERLEVLQAARARQLGRPALSAAEKADVATRAIEDEILYREALRLGLEADDPIVRQRLIQKQLFLAEELAGASRPLSDEALRACFDQDAARYRLPASLRLVHIFSSSRDALEPLRSAAIAYSAAPGNEARVPPLGEAFPLSRLVSSTLPELEAGFGDAFARSVHGLEVGTWSGPVASRYGWHLVRVLEREEARPATFEEVRSTLRLDCAVARREASIQRYLGQLFSRYRVTIDGNPVETLTPTRRTAARPAPSAED